MIETHIVTGSVSGNQGKSQGICSKLLNDLQRINTISQRFRHFSSLGIPYQSMKKNGLKRFLLHLLKAGENHADYPEENDIIAGYQYIRRIKIL